VAEERFGSWVPSDPCRPLRPDLPKQGLLWSVDGNALRKILTIDILLLIQTSAKTTLIRSSNAVCVFA
jgi:hypothetical protein